MNKIEVHIAGSFADTKRRVLDAVAAAEQGTVKSQTHIIFGDQPTLEQARRIISSSRQER